MNTIDVLSLKTMKMRIYILIPNLKFQLVNLRVIVYFYDIVSMSCLLLMTLALFILGAVVFILSTCPAPPPLLLPG